VHGARCWLDLRTKCAIKYLLRESGFPLYLFHLFKLNSEAIELCVFSSMDRLKGGFCIFPPFVTAFPSELEKRLMYEEDLGVICF
jgi:hypothetical protein